MTTTAASPPQRKRAAARAATGTAVALAAGLFALAAGLAVVSVLGPLVTGVIDYHIGESLRNQTTAEMDPVARSSCMNQSAAV